jgi:hypothetical protein
MNPLYFGNKATVPLMPFWKPVAFAAFQFRQCQPCERRQYRRGSLRRAPYYHEDRAGTGPQRRLCAPASTRDGRIVGRLDLGQPH